ncbi:hypothetical protein E2C01_066628 [Portunus trituberculatus]|uniref:Uncharacterized protein n=1 Tax=Portunus trituberculatus TaxID=210409 RepID=A0A5B7HSU9_PORTR|nr:hypothetical protein [Portunus trituberculatus]
MAASRSAGKIITKNIVTIPDMGITEDVGSHIRTHHTTTVTTYLVTKPHVPLTSNKKLFPPSPIAQEWPVHSAGDSERIKRHSTNFLISRYNIIHQPPAARGASPPLQQGKNATTTTAIPTNPPTPLLASTPPHARHLAVTHHPLPHSFTRY